MDENLITLSELKLRGWTDALIRRFMESPDETRPNPKYKRAGSPMKLYRLERIERIEASPDFAAERTKAEARQAAARKAVQTKQQRLQTYLRGLTIEVPLMEKEVLVKKARQNFSSLGLPDRVEWSTERMCVNYLRHCETRYEEELEAIAGKAGSSDAYLMIKDKVLMAISARYEWLADECDRQSEQLWKQQRQQDY